MPQDKQLNLRNLFHDLGNKHQVALLGAGITAESLGDMLKSPGLSSEDKEVLKKTIEGLIRIEKSSQKPIFSWMRLRDWFTRGLIPMR